MRINLARKFRKLMTSLDTYSQQLIKEMDDNPKTKLTTKNKAVELRSVVSQMCTVSMQAMLEDLESRNFNCARASSRCAMNRSTQTYSNEREMREAKIATNLRKEIDSCNLNELENLVRKTWLEETFRTTKETATKSIKDYNTAVVINTQITQDS